MDLDMSTDSQPSGLAINKEPTERQNGVTETFAAQWLIRKELRAAILLRRQARGHEAIIPDNADKPPVEYEMTPRELELRELRKKNNRVAASRWRKKRKEFQSHLNQLVSIEEQRRQALKLQFQKLSTEKYIIEGLWRSIDKQAGCQKESTSSSETDTSDLYTEMDSQIASSQSSCDSAMSPSRQTSQSEDSSCESSVPLICLVTLKGTLHSEKDAGENEAYSKWPTKRRRVEHEMNLSCDSGNESG